MDQMIGFIMLAVFIGLGIYPFTQSSFTFDTKYIAQMLISGFGAAYILYSSFNLSFLKNLFSRGKPVDKVTIDTSDSSLMDFKVLSYLKGRAQEIQSQKAVDLIVELNNILFSSDIKKELKHD